VDLALQHRIDAGHGSVPSGLRPVKSLGVGPRAKGRRGGGIRLKRLSFKGGILS
jgi:hypothetical protein